MISPHRQIPALKKRRSEGIKMGVARIVITLLCTLLSTSVLAGAQVSA